MGMNFTGYYTEEFYHNDDMFIFLDILARNNPYAVDAYLNDVNNAKLEMVRENYAEFRKFHKVSDFTDVLEWFVLNNKPLPVDVAIIDEAQDLTTLQWEVCRVAFSQCKRVYVAGDDDQAIYEWSGADVKRFLTLGGKRTILDKSYRLPSNILELAKKISSGISNRVEKDFEPVSQGGTINYYNSVDEVKIVPKESYYFLSRNNFFLRWHEDTLRQRALVYWKRDIISADPRVVAAINAFERVRQGESPDDLDIKYKRFLRAAVDMSKPWFDNFVLDLDELAYYRDLVRSRISTTETDLEVNSIHGVKGGEADNVVLLLDFTRAVKESFERTPDAELRCLYVAVTRARHNLHIIYSNGKTGYDYYLNQILGNTRWAT